MPIQMSFESSPNSGLLSATLQFSLKPYIAAWEASIRDKTEESKRQYIQIKKEYAQEMCPTPATLIWDQLISTATAHVSAIETIDMLRQSPAISIMRSHFSEILKNCVDENILSYAQSHHSTDLTITLSIHPDFNTNTIQLNVWDNGRGFGDFAQKVDSDEKRYQYVTTPRSSPKHGRKNIPDLFGGAGRGLAQLIAHIEYDAQLKAENQFNPSHKHDASSIHLTNHNVDGGALISIITPLHPRTAVLQQNEMEEAPVISEEMSAGLQCMLFKKRSLLFSRDKNVDEKENAQPNQRKGPFGY